MRQRVTHLPAAEECSGRGGTYGKHTGVGAGTYTAGDDGQYPESCALFGICVAFLLVFSLAYVRLTEPFVDGSGNIFYPARPVRRNAAKFKQGIELFRFHTVQRERYSDGGTRDSGERLAATYAYLAT
ncbi:MAG TPA: hypothetical protein DCL75_01580 [Ktedonobacter sp.]|nr:hypothetical protein [Ktedonobacter sp.]